MHAVPSEADATIDMDLEDPFEEIDRAMAELARQNGTRTSATSQNSLKACNAQC